MANRVIKNDRNREAAVRRNQASAAANRGWAEKERDRTSAEVTKRFRNIIILAAVLLILIITALFNGIANTASGQGTRTTVQYADGNYAASSTEISTMEKRASDFVTGMLASTYSSSEETARSARSAALAYVANTTTVYQELANVQMGNGTVAPENLKVVIEDVRVTSGSRSYEGIYTCKLKARVADSSTGEYVDSGYEYTIYFQNTTMQGEDGTSTSEWMIADVRTRRAV